MDCPLSQFLEIDLLYQVKTVIPSEVLYVELDTVCIRKEGNNLFQDFAKESWDQRLFLFRESIVKRFGFVACSTDPALQISSATFSTHHQYIHCTGNCFVLIPTRLDQVSGIQGIKKGMTDRKKAPGLKKDEGANPQETSSLISRHPEGKTNAKYEHDESGFLWSWNFMISKRWKNISNTGATGDIPFMDKLLADFRKFCNNEDNRLVDYWDECKQVISQSRL